MMIGPFKSIIGVDPGEYGCGFAGILVSPTAPMLYVSGVNFQNKRRSYRSSYHALASFLDRWNVSGQISPILIAIEGQFLARGKRQNVRSLITLSRSAGRWTDAADEMGIEYEFVNPSTWIAHELGRGLRTGQTEKVARQKTYAMYGHQLGREITDHECCATMIARYVAIREWNKSL